MLLADDVRCEFFNGLLSLQPHQKQASVIIKRHPKRRDEYRLGWNKPFGPWPAELPSVLRDAAPVKLSVKRKSGVATFWMHHVGTLNGAGMNFLQEEDLLRYCRVFREGIFNGPRRTDISELKGKPRWILKNC